MFLHNIFLSVIAKVIYVAETTGCLRIGIMCLNQVTCLPADSYIGAVEVVVVIIW